jgi:hypothetical protein
MARVIVLDMFPLSSTAKQEPHPGTTLTKLDLCQLWIKDCIQAGNHVVAPAINYYGALRELGRLNARSQIARLSAFCHTVSDRYLPLTDAHLDLAAVLWGTSAKCRNTHYQYRSLITVDLSKICDKLLQNAFPVFLNGFTIRTYQRFMTAFVSVV